MMGKKKNRNTIETISIFLKPLYNLTNIKTNYYDK